MQKNGPFALAFNALVVLFVLAPLAIVCLVAFTPESTLTVPTTQFSLRWFHAVFEHPNFMQAFKNSLWLAFLSASIAVCLAVPAAIASTKTMPKLSPPVLGAQYTSALRIAEALPA